MVKQRYRDTRSGYVFLTYLVSLLSLLALILVGCGNETTTTQQPVTPERVNGFGGNNNHGHSLIALPNNVLLMATHYGIFRSSDGGKGWATVAAGPGQLMETLMTYALAASPVDSQRIYVLTQPITNTHKGSPGLYRSADQGKSWSLLLSTEGKSNIFTEVPGNSSADEVYIYQREDGPTGLKISSDGGKTFKVAGTLPFPDINGLRMIPGAPGHLLVYGNSGIATSADKGASWQVTKAINSSIFDATTSGVKGPIYATGDAGVFVSNDAGKSFTQVNTGYYPGLSASATQPQTLYGKHARTVEESKDGGRTWKPLPTMKSNPNIQDLTPNPDAAATLYVSLSYPVEVYRFDQGTAAWSALTPKP